MKTNNIFNVICIIINTVFSVSGDFVKRCFLKKTNPSLNLVAHQC